MAIIQRQAPYRVLESTYGISVPYSQQIDHDQPYNFKIYYLKTLKLICTCLGRLLHYWCLLNFSPLYMHVNNINSPLLLPPILTSTHLVSYSTVERWNKSYSPGLCSVAEVWAGNSTLCCLSPCRVPGGVIRRVHKAGINP